MAFGFGPMKTMPCFSSSAQKEARFGQEAVTGMHRLGARRLAGRDDLFGSQITLRRCGRADMNSLVGHLDMQRVPIRIRIDRDGQNAHAARSLDHAAGDFAAIRDQDFLEHRDSTQKCIPEFYA